MDRATLAHLRHELRTPLNHIIGYGEMLLEDGGRPELEPGLRRILDDAAVLVDLVNHVLAPTSVEAGVVDLARLPAELGPPLERILGGCEAARAAARAGGADEAELDLERIAQAAVHLRDLVRGGLAPRVAERAEAMPLPHLPPLPSEERAPASAGGVILVVDDNEDNREMLARRLERQGYEVRMATGGGEALAMLAREAADLVLLDVMMPDLDGYTVLARLKAEPALRDIPVLMISSLDEVESVARCIELGADDYLPKPFSPVILRARVSASLEKKRLRDQEARHLRELAEWNRTLEERVQEQVGQVERLGRLKRFFSPQLAELIVAGGAADPLRTHRREVTVVFLDLRGFTAFAETAEPEEVMGMLREYHAETGRLIVEHEGTLERFTGDGMMIFFNDPVEVPDPAERAIRMAIAVRDRVTALATGWRKRGWDLALGVGIAQGYATIGAIGFEGRWDYGAIGTVTNLASRLCGEAGAGQILISARVAVAVETLIDADDLGPLALKGLARPVPTWRLRGLKSPGGTAG
jgi:class 3 adenylate cyclase